MLIEMQRHLLMKQLWINIDPNSWEFARIEIKWLNLCKLLDHRLLWNLIVMHCLFIKMNCVNTKILPHSFFCHWDERKKTVWWICLHCNMNKTNWSANHVRNLFGLIFFAHTCVTSFGRDHRECLLIAHWFLCNRHTIPLVGRNRTNYIFQNFPTLTSQ